MISIHTLSIGQPETLSDERGTWHSAIFRSATSAPVALSERGLAGDQVADTEHHGKPDQAVCCHPLEHYAYWQSVYAGEPGAAALGPGGVGENWTVSGASERDVCVGDIFQVGSARVQVTGPRYPCTKQERKLRLPEFHKRTLATLRTGFYLRVLTPGTVQAGDQWTLEARLYPELTVQRINECGHHEFDPDFAAQALAAPELSAVWRYVLQVKTDKHSG